MADKTKILNMGEHGSNHSDSNFSMKDENTIGLTEQHKLAVADGNVVSQSISNLADTVNTSAFEIPGTSTTNYGGKKMKLDQAQSDWRDDQILKLGSVQAYRNKYKIGKKTTITTPPSTGTNTSVVPGGTKINNNPIVQEFDPRSNQGRRQQLQGISSGQNKMKRLAMSDARASWTGMSKQEKKDAGGRSAFMKGKRSAAKLETNAVKRTQFKEVNRQREMQNKQGLFSGGGRKIQQNYTPVDNSSSRLYDTPAGNSKNFTFKSNLAPGATQLKKVSLLDGFSSVSGIGSGSKSNGVFGKKPGGTKVGNALRSAGGIFKKKSKGGSNASFGF